VVEWLRFIGITLVALTWFLFIKVLISSIRFRLRLTKALRSRRLLRGAFPAGSGVGYRTGKYFIGYSMSKHRERSPRQKLDGKSDPWWWDKEWRIR
jgi:hypothetical protein